MATVNVDTLWLALAVVVAVAAVVCAALLWRRSERRQLRMMGRLRQDADRQSEAVARLSEGLNAALRQIEAMSGAMENRQDRMRRTLDERMELMNQANERRLEQMQALVTDKLDGKLNESFQAVNGQLANVHRGLGEMRELAMGVTDLQKMLGGVKTRGIWGEVRPAWNLPCGCLPGRGSGCCPSTPSFPRRTTCAWWRPPRPGTPSRCAAVARSWSGPLWSRRGASTTSTSARP